MLVKDLKVGMLLVPKGGAIFRHHENLSKRIDDRAAEHLECYVLSSHKVYQRYADLPVAKQHIVYLGKAEKAHQKIDLYEYRHRVFVPALGREMRLASECWRSIEPLDLGRSPQ